MESQGSEQAAIDLTIDELNLSDYITLTGQLSIDQIAIRLANADIGMLYEERVAALSGLKLLDYKAAGLATIVSGENDQPTIIKHGRSGWIVPPCDDESLYEAIIHLVQDVDLRKQLGREARLEAEKLHLWSNTANQLSELFLNVLYR